MEQNLQKLFKSVKYHPESRLSVDIWNLIESKDKKIIKMKIVGYFSISLLSLFGSIFSIKNLISESIRLGFYEYFSLIFSDSGFIAKYWKEYTLSLVDSLPILSLVLSFFLLFILSISVRRISFQFKNKLLTI